MTGSEFERRVEETLKSGDDFAEEYRLAHADGETRWVLARGRCYRDSTGQPTRFPGAAIDITDRKLAEEHKALLTDELSHRSRNMLAIVQAIAQQTLKDGVTMAEARKKLSARLVAMSKSQDILMGRGVAGVELEFDPPSDARFARRRRQSGSAAGAQPRHFLTLVALLRFGVP